MTTPVTAATASILAFWYVFLLKIVVKLRRSEKVGLGTGDNSKLEKAVRVHGNFAENIPFALVLLLLVETTGVTPYLPIGLGLILLLGRWLHFVGLKQSRNYSKGRFYGTVLTVAHFVISAVFLLTTVFLSF